MRTVPAPAASDFLFWDHRYSHFLVDTQTDRVALATVFASPKKERCLLCAASSVCGPLRGGVCKLDERTARRRINRHRPGIFHHSICAAMAMNRNTLRASSLHWRLRVVSHAVPWPPATERQTREGIAFWVSLCASHWRGCCLDSQAGSILCTR